MYLSGMGIGWRIEMYWTRDDPIFGEESRIYSQDASARAIKLKQ